MREPTTTHPHMTRMETHQPGDSGTISGMMCGPGIGTGTKCHEKLRNKNETGRLVYLDWHTDSVAYVIHVLVSRVDARRENWISIVRT